jgi:GAF domain-containing protein
MSEAPRNSNPGELTEELRRLLLAVEASGRAILPSSNDELLQTIVEAAARIFGAAAASIALVDEKGQALEFQVAYGAGRDEVIGMRIPLDRGIAGYVAMTGQPIAVSNVQEDTRFNKDFAKSTGYVPRSILAMPLISDDRVIGVMEVLDKISAPSFGMQDMELLGMFARQAAIAIHQSQQYDLLNESLVRGIKRLAGEDISSDLLSALEPGEDEGSRERDLLALADLFNAIGELGDAERHLCVRVLEAFAEHAARRRGNMGTRGHGDAETRGHGDAGTRGQGE